MTAELELTDFRPFPKIPRLSREMIVTEKIDGTNGAVVVRAMELGRSIPQVHEQIVQVGDSAYGVSAQSRKRIITPKADNYGFAAFVHANAQHLAYGLSVGRHFGEWWGQGIQRNYGLKQRRFSLFNTARWNRGALDATGLSEIGVHVVPTLAVDTFDTKIVDELVERLATEGSKAAAGWKSAEGVVVYHAAANQLFKRLIENDEIPKGEVAA